MREDRHHKEDREKKERVRERERKAGPPAPPPAPCRASESASAAGAPVVENVAQQTDPGTPAATQSAADVTMPDAADRSQQQVRLLREGGNHVLRGDGSAVELTADLRHRRIQRARALAQDSPSHAPEWLCAFCGKTNWLTSTVCCSCGTQDGLATLLRAGDNSQNAILWTPLPQLLQEWNAPAHPAAPPPAKPMVEAQPATPSLSAAFNTMAQAQPMTIAADADAGTIQEAMAAAAPAPLQVAPSRARSRSRRHRHGPGHTLPAQPAPLVQFVMVVEEDQQGPPGHRRRQRFVENVVNPPPGGANTDA